MTAPLTFLFGERKGRQPIASEYRARKRRAQAFEQESCWERRKCSRAHSAPRTPAPPRPHRAADVSARLKVGRVTTASSTYNQRSPSDLLHLPIKLLQSDAVDEDEEVMRNGEAGGGAAGLPAFPQPLGESSLILL